MKHVLTNVRLSLPMLQGLKHRAVEERRPAAALIREAVTQYLARPPARSAGISTTAWLRGLTKLVKPGPGPRESLAVDHDHYLYGAPRKSRRPRSR